MTDFDWKTLDDLDDAPLLTNKVERKQFPCMKCSATGKWSSSYGRAVTGKCHACNGRGHFLTSPDFRAKARKGAKVRKVNKTEANIAAFKEEHPEVWKFLNANMSWNNFFRDLVDRTISKTGQLSKGQMDAVLKAVQAHDERNEAKKKDTIELDLSEVLRCFDKAIASGLKRPKMNFEKLIISLAPATGKNAGHLYIKDTGEVYSGKVDPDGRFWPSYNCSEEVKDSLKEISGDPIEAAKAYGRRTGNCCMCHKKLTDPNSVAQAMGAICASRFFGI